MKEDIDIEGMVDHLKEKIKEGYYLCLGFDPEDAGKAIVVEKQGIFLKDMEGIEPIRDLEKYKETILETVGISERQKRPLSERYLKDFLHK